MERMELIEAMEKYILKLQEERKVFKSQASKDDNARHFYAKTGHEISALENAIRELRRE